MAPKKKDRTAREGFALLLAPHGVTGASAGGVECPVDEDGLVEAPADAVPALLEHGFQPFE